MAWQKVCSRSGGIERGTVGRGKDDAGGPDGGADCTGAGNAHADGACGLISGSSHDGSARTQAGGFRSRGRNSSADLWRLEKSREQFQIDARFAENFRRPTAIGYIEQKRAGSVRHVDGAFAGQAEANVIFGQHDVGDAGPICGSVSRTQRSLVSVKLVSGGLQVSRISESRPKMSSSSHALGFAALVAPDDGVAHDFIGGIEQDCTVHLAGEADAGDVIWAQIGGMKSLADSRAAGSPPVARILLGPAGARTAEGLVVVGAGSDDFAGGVHDERAGAAGTNVDAEISDVASFEVSS